jgi:hypothetical protein
MSDRMTAMELTLDQIELAGENAEPMGDDVLLSARVTLDAILQWAKEQDRRLKEAMTRHIQMTGRDLVIGTVRYYVGTKKDTKDRSPRHTLEVLLEAVAGDLDKLAEALSTNAIKHGAARTILIEALGEDAGRSKWVECFVVEEKTELKEGKPVRVKELVKVDERFIR